MCPEILTESFYTSAPYLAYAAVGAEEICLEKVLHAYDESLLSQHNINVELIWKVMYFLHVFILWYK